MYFLKRTHLGFLAIASLAAADEDHGWELTGAAGLTYAEGNSDSVAYSIQVLASYLDEKNETYLGADWFYAEDGGVASTDRFLLSAQQNRRLDERWHIGGIGSWQRDDIAGIDRRIDLGLLLGYRAIDSERATLTLEVGPGYAWEKQGGTSRSFAGLRLAEKFEYEFTETTKLWQSLSWTPKIEDFADYLIDLELGIETRITDRWSLRTFARHRIDSTPAAGRGRSDTSLVFGAAYDLGGLGEPGDDGGRRSLMPDEDTDDDDEDGWSSVASLGLSLVRGNSESLSANFGWNTAYEDDEREFFFDLSHALAENQGATSQDQTRSRVQLDRYLSERFYFGGSIRYLRDAPADIDYRIISGIGPGYALIKTDRTRLSIGAGPAYTFEQVGRNRRNFASLVAAQRFRHDFSKRVSLEQALVYAAEISDFDNFNLAATVTLDTELSGRLIWRLGTAWLYDNRPAAGRRHHDLTITNALAVKF